MTTYLTKMQNGHTFHFRVTVEQHLYAVVEGQFYNWINKYGRNYETPEDAEKVALEMIKKKLHEGFKLSEYSPTLENNEQVFDKAKWHFERDFPEDLNAFQAYIHTGLFLGWLVDRGLVSEDFKNDYAEEIQLFRERILTGPQLFECCDGILMLEDLSEYGNRFALPYFNFESGQFLKDYDETLCRGLPSQYHVADTWYNYLALSEILDKRLAEWEAKN